MSGARIGYLGLGSNVGERRANLQAAVDGLAARGVRVLESSSTYDTDPVGEILDQPTFLNACLRVETALEPLELLDLCKELERELGRAAGGPRHAPRVIDIDVLALGDLVLRSERLSLPHAELLTRRFVLIPLLELDFELRTPAGERLADALAALDFDEGVRRAGPRLALPA
ncbi:MAG TPA: 2-amino-4-hydroxy-6-hydroxymethyldihydropteridine diphosphokinase [Solirubrobacteraceae bacterium]|nr:2-amino-4-hydroxy-6-hydroxymethyldihydropteridine diphosphokinase [Solirubrobacteraceae bacterium]